MQSTKISILKAAVFGAAFGLAFTVISNFGSFGSANMAFTAGQLIGGTLGGALLGSIVVAIVNLFRK